MLKLICNAISVLSNNVTFKLSTDVTAVSLIFFSCQIRCIIYKPEDGRSGTGVVVVNAESDPAAIEFPKFETCLNYFGFTR